MPTRKSQKRGEEAALTQALEKILQLASKRFEGQSCSRCSQIEALAVEALRATAHDDTSPISVRQLDALLERKRK